MKYLLSLLIILSVVTITNAQEREFVSKEGDQEFHMKMYWMLIYVRGEKAQDFSEEELVELQNGHMAHIGAMAEADVVRMAGPFNEDGDKRGILIFDVDTKEEVIEWIEQDPSVKAGRLTYEIYGWWTEKGACLE